jgi:hypothetical protein
MLERLGRLCVGLGALWVLIVVGYWLLVGLERPEEWTPYIDKAMSSGFRQTLYSLLTYVVTPIGMMLVTRDIIVDEGPLWLKFASPGVFVSVYVLLLAAATDIGQSMLLQADPVVAAILPGMVLGKNASQSLTSLARFGGLLLVLAGIPGLLGGVLGLLAGGRPRR